MRRKSIILWMATLLASQVFGQDSGMIHALRNTIEYLSSDVLNGRLTGSKEEQIAADYILARFQNIGLEAQLQPFEAQYQSKQQDSLRKYTFNSRNVIGYLDNGAPVTIVIGAHYDHIGRNEFHLSKKVNSESIHNGADDNASGVSAVLALAEWLSSNSIEEKTNFLFVCFSGEELGLLGSKYFVKHYPSDADSIYAMVNMDMIGRLDSIKTLYIGGVGTAAAFEQMVHHHNTLPFQLKLDSSGMGPSDHSSFYLAGIPVLFFHTGSHEDYHTPEDDAEKINIAGTYQIVDYIYHILLDIAQNQNLVFQKTAYTPKSSGRNYKVSLGIMPEYENSGNGLILAGVVKGRIADTAGLQANDVILAINDCRVQDVYSYMECLSLLVPGDLVTITFSRDKLTYTQKVKL